DRRTVGKLADSARCLDPVQTRHGDVHERDRRLERLDKVDRLLAVFGDPDHFERFMGVDGRSQSLAKGAIGRRDENSSAVSWRPGGGRHQASVPHPGAPVAYSDERKMRPCWGRYAVPAGVASSAKTTP